MRADPSPSSLVESKDVCALLSRPFARSTGASALPIMPAVAQLHQAASHTHTHTHTHTIERQGQSGLPHKPGSAPAGGRAAVLRSTVSSTRPSCVVTGSWLPLWKSAELCADACCRASSGTPSRPGSCACCKSAASHAQHCTKGVVQSIASADRLEQTGCAAGVAAAGKADGRGAPW